MWNFPQYSHQGQIFKCFFNNFVVRRNCMRSYNRTPNRFRIMVGEKMAQRAPREENGGRQCSSRDAMGQESYH